MNTGSNTLPGCHFTANQFCCDCKDNVRLMYTFTCLNPCNGPETGREKKIQSNPKPTKNPRSNYFLFLEWNRLRMLQPHLPRQQRLPKTPRSNPPSHPRETQAYHTKPGAINKHHSAPTTTEPRPATQLTGFHS